MHGHPLLSRQRSGHNHCVRMREFYQTAEGLATLITPDPQTRTLPARGCRTYDPVMQEIPCDPELRRFYTRWEEALHDVLPEAGWRAMCAVSGGCDSVTLAWLFRESARRGAGDVVLGHVNHGLRPEADREEAFVRELARSWGVPCRVARVQPRTLARRHGWSLEQAAREARFAALSRLTRAARCNVIALGHQMDDQAETLLLRILRGTGPRGLGGMQPRIELAPDRRGRRATLWIIRPLLGFRRGEIRSLAVRAGLEWSEDSSNRDRRFLRNRIRSELIPELTASYNPRLVESLAELAQWQRIETDWVVAAAEQVRARATLRRPRSRPLAGLPARVQRTRISRRTYVLDATLLALEPPAVISRVLWSAYQELVGPHGVLSGRQVSDLLALVQRPACKGPADLHLTGGVRASRGRERITLAFHNPRPARKPRKRARQPRA